LSVEDILDDLEGIWKYAAIDYHHKANELGIDHEIREANEYAITISKMWDYLDKIDVDTIERAIVELEGRLMRDAKTVDKILKSQIMDYMDVRMDTSTSHIE